MIVKLDSDQDRTFLITIYTEFYFILHPYSLCDILMHFINIFIIII